MKRIYLLLGVIVFGCSGNKPFKQLQLVNSTDLSRSEVVTLDVSGWTNEGQEMQLKLKTGETVPFEQEDSDGDGSTDAIRLIAQLEPQETREIEVVLGEEEVEVPKKMTQAELSIKEGGQWEGREYVGGTFKNVKELTLPAEHTDHSYFIRYEGPGWESNLVGYRFYLDWRNGVDIFGKKTEGMVLQDVGQDGFDSYHEESDWGLDILKVGSSLGMGSIGRHLNDSLYRFQDVDSTYCTIEENGLLKSVVRTEYYNWTTENDSTDVTSVISIEAESRLSKHEVSLSNPIEGFCTGLVINEDENFFDISEGTLRALGTYGGFSLNNDKMGMAIMVQNDQVSDVFEDEYSHVVTFKPMENIAYYFMAVWEKDPGSITDAESFQSYVSDELKKLANPIEVAEVQ